MKQTRVPEHAGAGAPVRRFEPHLAVVILLVLAAYFSRAHVLPLRGEEPTRAQIAFEMVHGHDWLVPREQGEPFGIRPPLQDWVIALSCLGLNDWGRFAVRFHSLMATLLITLLIYGYGRAFLTRNAALLAAVVFATLPEWFQMGRQAETEALFTLFVGGSLLTWHWGMTRDWPGPFTWVASYVLVGLGMLTKGPQAPVYFIGATTIYLVILHDWRRLFGVPHLLGVLAGTAVVLAWDVPYARAVGWPDAIRVWFAEASVSANVAHIGGWQWRDALGHWVRYPAEVAAGLLPWSVLLFFCLRADVRQWIRTSPSRSPFVFCTVAIAFAFSICWLLPTGIPRYFAPLYPCLAVLIGVILDYLMSSAATDASRRVWHAFTTVIAWTMIIVALVLIVGPFIARRLSIIAPWVEPILPTLAYAFTSAALAIVVFRFAARSIVLVVLAIAAFLTTTFIGLGTDIRAHRSEDAHIAIEQIRRNLPPNTELVSLGGHTSSLFAYYFGLPLIRPHRPIHSADDARDVKYFCTWAAGNQRPNLPFAWEEVGRASMDRNHHDVPETCVVVGHRAER